MFIEETSSLTGEPFEDLHKRLESNYCLLPRTRRMKSSNSTILSILFLFVEAFTWSYAINGSVSYNIADNSRSHKTDSFYRYPGNQDKLIIRRGGIVSLSVTTSPDSSLLITLYSKALDVNVTSFNVSPSSNFSTDSWCANSTGNGSDIDVKINIPVTSPVGVYRLTISSHQENETLWTTEKDVYILFNPWNADDETFLPFVSLRDEYVLNDIGKNYFGASGYYQGKKWVYGQFEPVVLTAAMMLLDKDPLRNLTERSNVIRLSRRLSNLVNANDEFGVLIGRWQGSYADGTSPGDWVSSVDILDKFVGSGGQPVKYAQCWVFANVLTSILRCLGVPARQITTFGSAHDTDNSLTIDKYYDEEGNEIEGIYGSDSIWNFHAWTEAWMARGDIDRPYGGWQVVDATPQEQSLESKDSKEIRYQTGPAPVLAVKEGDVDVHFDLNFVFAEVSAPQVDWKRDPNATSGWRRLSSSSAQVGYQILTKIPGRMNDSSIVDYMDVTYEYKHKSEDRQRLALLNAANRAGVDLLIGDGNTTMNNGVTLDLWPINETQIGEDINIQVYVKNNLEHKVNVVGGILVQSTYYNGMKGNLIRKDDVNITLDIDQGTVFNMTIPFKDYYEKLIDHCLVYIDVQLLVKETYQLFIERRTISLKLPKVEVTIMSGKIVDGKKMLTTQISIKNSMDVALSGGTMSLHGNRKYTDVVIPDIQAHDTMKTVVTVTVDDSKVLIANVNFDQLTHLRGSAMLTVEYAYSAGLQLTPSASTISILTMIVSILFNKVVAAAVL